MQGRSLEFEVHPKTGPNGLTPIGACTFLSYTPVMDEANVMIKVVPSFVKLGIAKGRSQTSKGKDLDFAIAQRAMDPRLGASPYGQAMRQMYMKHVAISPPPQVRREINPYKLEFNSEALTEAEEFRYLQAVIPGVTIEEYQAELEVLRTNTEMPMPVLPGSMRIFRALARLRYGLKADDLNAFSGYG